MLFFVLLLLILNGCSTNSNTSNKPDEGLFKYEGSLIGDNSAVVNIIGQLRHDEAFQEVSLETKKEPYGMTVTYNNIDAERIEQETKETTIYNATFLFALIDNAEWIAFDFEDYHYNVTRTELENWYGKELNGFTSEKELEAFVKEQVKDESKVDQLFTD